MKAEISKEILAKAAKLDTNLLPNVTLFWTCRKNGSPYAKTYSLKTHEFDEVEYLGNLGYHGYSYCPIKTGQYYPNKKTLYIRADNSEHYILYTKYLGDSWLQIGQISIVAHRVKNRDEEPSLQLAFSFLIRKGDPTPYDIKGNVIEEVTGTKRYSTYVTTNIHELLLKSYYCDMGNQVWAWLGEDSFKLGRHEYESRYNGHYVLEPIYKYSSSLNHVVKNSKLDKYLEFLPETDVEDSIRVRSEFLHEVENINGKIRFTIYFRDHIHNVILFDKKTCTCFIRAFNEWDLGKAESQGMKQSTILNARDIEILHSVYPHLAVNVGDNILMAEACLQTDIYEKLKKLGYTALPKTLCGATQSQLEQSFGFKRFPRVTKGNPEKTLGLNKYCLDEYERKLKARSRHFTSPFFSSVALLKELFNNIISFDKTRSENAVCTSYTIINDYAWIRLKRMLHNKEMYNQIQIRYFNLPEQQQQVFVDCLSLLMNMSWYNPTYRVEMIQTISNKDIPQFHDRLVNSLSEMRAERERMAELSEQKRIEHFNDVYLKSLKERESKFNKKGETFLIRMPIKLDEISVEGDVLSHCVRGYIENHANSYTNILFLRKVDQEDTPFYTIEVTNNEVRQIHGLHNRWLGNNPEVIPFVLEWLTEKGISCNSKILLNKGLGYVPSKESLDPKQFGL